MQETPNLNNMDRSQLIEIILKQQKDMESLQKELAKYKNSNTPPSANKHLKSNTQGLKSKDGKRGAPKGHKGTTRKQIPIRKEVIDIHICPKCNSHSVVDKQILKRIVEDVSEEVKPETVEAELHKKRCKDCGHVFIPKHNTVPLKGKFGINIMVLVIFIKFLLRGVLRKSSTFLDNGFALKMTPATINSIIKRVADASEAEYDALKYRIRTAHKIYVDETSFSVLGKNQWVWVFRTDHDILLVIRPSRGNNVLEEILGKDYIGTVICDCWRAYNYLSNAQLQRCWAHLIRKTKVLDTIAGINFHKKVKSLFEEIKQFNSSEHTELERTEKYEVMTKELKKIIQYYSKYDDLMPVVKYIKFNLGNWFTCIKVEGVEPTNNFAEQAIRETVMVRKIIGAFRSESGKENYEIMASLMATWQLNDLDLKAELKQMLIKNLCFC